MIIYIAILCILLAVATYVFGKWYLKRRVRRSVIDALRLATNNSWNWGDSSWISEGAICRYCKLDCGADATDVKIMLRAVAAAGVTQMRPCPNPGFYEYKRIFGE
jgi:type II secretory pathway pseudopilin PulG